MSNPRSREVQARRGAPRRPSRVRFWWRRTVALGLAVAVVGGAAAVVGVLSGPGTAATGPEFHRTAPPSPAPTAAGAPRRCGAQDVRLSVATSNPTVRTGSPVSFRVEIRRVGSRPCLADGSEAGRAVVIMSGSARVWSSADCSTGSRMLLLGAGDVDVQTVTWNGKTSAPNCGGPRAIAGAGTYSVAAELAGVQGSAGEPLTLTITAPPPPPTPTAPATGTGTPSGPTASATGTGTPSGPAASAPAAKPGPAASAPADPAKP